MYKNSATVSNTDDFIDIAKNISFLWDFQVKIPFLFYARKNWREFRYSYFVPRLKEPITGRPHKYLQQNSTYYVRYFMYIFTVKNNRSWEKLETIAEISRNLYAEHQLYMRHIIFVYITVQMSMFDMQHYVAQ
jgi:hypothetical protein